METEYKYHHLDEEQSSNSDEVGVEDLHFTQHTQSRARRATILRCFGLASHVVAWMLVCLFAYREIMSQTWGWDRFRQHKAFSAQLTYSPAQEAIEYNVHVFQQGIEAQPGAVPPEFAGPPSNRLDQAWSDLYNYGMSTISKEEAARLTNKTSPLPDDPEKYIVQLDVFHQLHCLNRLRKALNPVYFCPRSNPHCDDHRAMGVDYEKPELVSDHLNHCIHSLRQSLMCHADVAPVVWHKSPHPRPNGDYFNMGFLSVTHTCRNFDKIKQWALERTMQGDFDTSIVPPEDGISIPVYP